MEIAALRLRFKITLALACLCTGSVVFAQRLPSGVRPEHYELRFTPDLKAATFTGEESIEVAIDRPTTAIVLNAAEIGFESASVSSGGQKQAAAVSLDKDREQATLTVANAVPAGKATIEIHFRGILNDKLRGFYLSKTTRRSYAVTQFEALDARRAFPCFDEPALKATFRVTLEIDKGDTGISNTPVSSDTAGPRAGKHTVTFETTPRMSTYLVAFLVGDFQCTSGEQDKVAIRVCSTPALVSHTAYGLEIAKQVLHYYNSYFGISYPLPKLDLIAVPDFEEGAMENFGAITYREQDLLLDPKAAPIESQINVAYVIAHEMAHQWFGDLVTMQWWNNVWLNEGFATWMGMKAIGVLHPEWNMDERAVNALNTVMNLDSLPSTRAVRAIADTPDEINQMFDGITYRKAAAVLLMVENYIGGDAFRQGVHTYLDAHKFGNATAEDFWGAQTAMSHKPVDKIMESLMTQPGVPVLVFGDPAHGALDVEQRRFFLNPGLTPKEAQTWTLPVCFQASHVGGACQLLAPRDSSLNVPTGEFFFPNAGGKGYYRMQFTPANFDALLAHAEGDLSGPERLLLAGNEWAEMRANQASVGNVLNLLAAMKSDPSGMLLNQVSEDLNTVIHQIATTEVQRRALGDWVRDTWGPQLKEMGDPAPSDSPSQRQLRAGLLTVVGSYGNDPAVLARARAIAEAYLASPESVDPTLARAALDVAAANGDGAFFDRLQKIYETGSNPDVQEAALRLLAQFERPELTERALAYSLSENVRNQDAGIQLRELLGNPVTRDLAWRYIKSHWTQVQAQFTAGSGGYVVAATGSFCSAEARDDVERFFAEHPVPNSSISLRTAKEKIEDCIELRTLQQPKLEQWLGTLTAR